MHSPYPPCCACPAREPTSTSTMLYFPCVLFFPVSAFPTLHSLSAQSPSHPVATENQHDPTLLTHSISGQGAFK
eukprot:1157912-Pelagomonas_calceolata.AAC.4